MSLGEVIGLLAGTAIVLLFALREAQRRLCIHYEYRWDSFAIRGLFGRQLFQIRQNEIDSLKVQGIGHRLTDRFVARFLPRSHFGSRVVIRATAMRHPVVISWEGQPIAGLTPEGLKPRSPGEAKHR
jgi:hypothetical protein